MMSIKNRILDCILKVKMKNLMLCFAFLVAMSPAYAGKTYMALVPTSTEFFAIVTVTEKPCVASEGNALFISEMREVRVSALGCWKQEGNSVIVEWTVGDKVPSTFDFGLFRPISDDRNKTIKQGSKVLLTCSATGWVGDILVDRDVAGVLQKLIVAGEDVRFEEKGTAINFSHKGKNISLSTATGIFNYETSGFQSYLNNRLLGSENVKGTGSCKFADATKKF